MIQIVMLLLLISSMFGYVFYLSRKMSAEFAVGFVMAGIISLLYFSGILNILPESAAVIFAGGFVFLILAIKNRTPLKNLFTFGIIFFVFGAFSLFFLLRGTLLTHQDDFEHWALIPKLLITENRFPNFTRMILQHNAYPPGSAVWIYFIVHMTGVSAEYMQLLAQALLLLGSLISLFPFAETVFEKFATAGIILILLCGNNNLRVLQVDQLVSLIPLSAVCFGLYYRKDIKERILYLLPWLVCIIAVKTGGALFVLFILVMLLPFAGWRRTAGAGLFTGFAFLLWQKHVRLVFPDSMLSRHALSLCWWDQVLDKKTAENLTDTCRLFFQREFSLNNRIIFLLLSGALIFILCKKFRTENGKLSEKLFLYAASFYIVYQLGLLAVYLISMPQSEAANLNAYTRYHRTIIVFISGILWLALLVWKHSMPSSSRIFQLAVSCICLGLLFHGISPKFSEIRRQSSEDTARRKAFEHSVEDYSIAENKKYMILTEVKNPPVIYESALVYYLYDPADAVLHMSLAEFIEKKNQWKKYDYMILPDGSEEVRSAVRELFHTDETVIDLAEMRKMIQ